MDLALLKRLIGKYDVNGPRYTSYPTAPHWKEGFGPQRYRDVLGETSQKENQTFALYAHIPFCETLCYYCGCNIHITKDQDRSVGYVERLKQEVESVGQAIGRKARLSQISLGGGTPTFLSESQLETLYAVIQSSFVIEPEAEVSIEIDPRVTSDEKMRTLRRLGFNRLSLGVQDFDETVQKAVNRVQSLELTQHHLSLARELGFSGINFDFIYGLPFQTTQSFRDTLREITRLKPDRIAFYNYAHLPSLRPHQKILGEYPMPSAEDRMDIFLLALETFLAAGYEAIGMDHFALASDELSKAARSGTLYRNFMGYTVKRAGSLLGVGCSAIGEVKDHYFQNIREAAGYESAISKQGLASFRGIELDHDDKRRKWIIQSVLCSFRVDFAAYEGIFGEKFLNHFARELESLRAFERDKLVEIGEHGFVVGPMGRFFIRNIAMVFDSYLGQGTKATYSRTV